MSKRIAVEGKNAPSLFELKRLTPAADGTVFDCSISEYNEYLKKEALKAQNWRYQRIGRNSIKVSAHI